MYKSANESLQILFIVHIVRTLTNIHTVSDVVNLFFSGGLRCEPFRSAHRYPQADHEAPRLPGVAGASSYAKVNEWTRGQEAKGSEDSRRTLSLRRIASVSPESDK